MRFDQLVSSIIERSREVPAKQSMLVGISGIDASGKGYVTGKLSNELNSLGCKTAVINVDGWLNLPPVRFDPRDLAANFYRNAIRFDEMFESLIFPLKQTRSVDLTADYTEETATEYRKHHYQFENIDIILLEGIFLLKRELVQHYDLRIWIDCSFETGLLRAIGRSQEGLNKDETVKAYATSYFPAQKIHFAQDRPRDLADIIFNNDK